MIRDSYLFGYCYGFDDGWNILIRISILNCENYNTCHLAWGLSSNHLAHILTRVRHVISDLTPKPFLL